MTVAKVPAHSALSLAMPKSRGEIGKIDTLWHLGWNIDRLLVGGNRDSRVRVPR
jgi:hypothetical protein